MSAAFHHTVGGGGQLPFISPRAGGLVLTPNLSFLHGLQTSLDRFLMSEWPAYFQECLFVRTELMGETGQRVVSYGGITNPCPDDTRSGHIFRQDIRGQ